MVLAHMDIIRLRGDKVAPESQCQIPRFESGFSNRDNRQCSLCNITVYIVKMEQKERNYSSAKTIIWTHRILNDRMEKPFKGRRFVYNLLYRGECARIS